MTGVAYTLDNLGNRISVTDENGKTTGYTYDNLNQLAEVQYPDTGSVTYTYDPVGNRLSANNTNYAYDSANRLIQAGGIPYCYNANGNLVSVGEAVYYDYDHENRLIQFADGTNAYQYTYDGDGNRLTQTVTGAVYESYNYIYDINAGLPLLLAEIDSQGNANNYLYANGLYSRTSSGGMLFYHADGLGSVSVISNVYGEPLNRYTYDPFGNPLTVDETLDNMFRFTGEPYDPSGLVFLRARYYDPFTGRFLTPDTFPGKLTDPLSQNLYVYCGNNPVVYIDPSGHMTAGQALGSFKAGISIATDSNTYIQSWNVAKDGLGNTWNDAQNTAVYKELAPIANDFMECPLIPAGGVKTVGSKLIKFNAGKKICEGTGSNVAKTANVSNYRNNFLEVNPNIPKKYQVHHSLPQKYENILNDTRINIHETQYLRGIDPTIHSKITNEWTKWDKSLGRTPTAQEIINFSKQIDSKYGNYWYKP